MAKLTSETSEKSKPQTCEASPNAISSPGSAAGLMPCGLLAGPITDLFGQEVAPVRVSAPAEKA